MGLTIYGTARSRTLRVLWLAEELGLEYDHIDIAVREAGGHPELATVNPFLRVPAIEDDGLRLWETHAILHYLARRHGAPLGPKDLGEEALMLAWSIWAVAECEPPAHDIFWHRVLHAPDARDEAVVARAEQALGTPLSRMETQLEEADYLVGGRFTMADLAVASILGWLSAADIDLGQFPAIGGWLTRCQDRPAHRRVQEMRAAA